MKKKHPGHRRNKILFSLANEHGRLIEIPLVLGFAGIALAIIIPDLVQRHWRQACVHLGGLVAAIIITGVFLAVLDSMRKRFPAKQAARRAPYVVPTAANVARNNSVFNGSFLLFGSAGSFAALLVVSFFSIQPWLAAALAIAVGAALGFAGSRWIGRHDSQT